MSEDFLSEYLSAELRRDPTNEHLQRMLQHRLRFLRSRGDRPLPPARQRDKALQRLLADRPLDAPDGQRPPSPLPIDEEVKQLIDDKVIIEPVRKGAYWIARSAVVDGCAWGDYYARLKLGREPQTKANAKMVSEDADALSRAIEDFLYEHSSFLTSSPIMGASGAVKDLQRALRELDIAQVAVERISDAVRPFSTDLGGSSGDPWKVGFVYGISHGWLNLTERKISPASDRFVSFVAQGAASLDSGAARNSGEWKSAIRTAVRAFGRNEDKTGWHSAPGDPPQQHETSTTE